MGDDRNNEKELFEKLNLLQEKQNHFEERLAELNNEVEELKLSLSKLPSETQRIKEASGPSVTKPSTDENLAFSKPKTVIQSTENIEKSMAEFRSFEARKHAYLSSGQTDKTKYTSNLEKFIGENLINKIGILITIIGVGIGAKYAIDHQLISPLARILLGYLVGIILFGFALKLKKDYNSFSAVLMSGAMAIVYFITYAAFTYYSLMPRYLAFGLMVVITVFTVYEAIRYDRQVIALIGMTGAYGIPFLLSDDSGKFVALFTYMSIINLGIMILAFKKYWKPLYYVSFVLTWVIFTMWFYSPVKIEIHYHDALIFSSIFYLTFYVTYLSYNLIRKELFNAWDVLLMLANTFIFYGIGYTVFTECQLYSQYLGLFTLIMALIQAIVSVIIYKMKLADWHLFYFISTLALTFLTILIPVQFNGNWITLLWAGEAGILFWIGRAKQISVYEYVSYIVMILATLSLLTDWNVGYHFGSKTVPVTNIYFVTSILFMAIFTFITMLNRDKDYQTKLDQSNVFYRIMQIVIPGILLFTLFFMFRVEISNYFNQQIAALSGAKSYLPSTDPNFQHYTDLNQFRILFLLDYSILFFTGLSIFNIRVLKNRLLGHLNLYINLIIIILFLTQGLFALSELRDSFLNQTSTAIYHPGSFNFIFRYITYLVILPMLIVCYRYIRQEFIDYKLDKAYSLLLHVVILWILSSELITWIDFFNGNQSYKLGLSILWGCYALLLIALGIWKKQQQLRIGAIVLFSGTLLKLFVYDLSDMGTISRTIVFVTLGILLLIISFLYNKYKHNIWNDSVENKEE